MPTTTSIAYELWTADEFLDWLEPGVFADLIDGEILMHSPVSLLHGNLTNFLDRLLAAYIDWVLDPKILAHRFYSRQDNLLLEFGQNEQIIRSASIPGFWVKRSWLDRQLRANPTVAEALAQIVA